MIRPGHGPRRPMVALATIGVLAASAIAVAPAALAQDPAKPYEGVTLNLSTYSAVPEYDYYATLMDEFKELTGITVNYVQQPVAAQDQKIPLQLSAKDPSLDVFFTGSENIGAYLGVSGVAPLDDFINDASVTAADYDFGDIAPAVQAACQQGGVNYCIASKTGGGLLYYNTRMFAEAGITAPPQNPAELLDYAQRLTNDDHAGFCVRADITQALYDAFQLWQWFYPYDNPVTGNYFRQDWSVLLAEEPYASAFGEFWREILTTAAPAGISTYKVTDCLQAFQQGRVAMWHDDSSMIPDVLDPETSLVAEESAFWSLPCQDVNPDNCGLVQPFGVWINNASENKAAAWQLVQFLTSKETQAAAAQAGVLLTPSRLSVLQDPATVAALPATFPEALTHILQHPNVTLLPFIPEGVAIIPPIQQGLQELITTDRPVAEVMAEMGAGIQAIMTDAGYPKDFPEF
ncbi:MAG: extracellular solute-binding protein [Chloroflexi bacterium]|nr:extracellular solute-binding protein [Chloroflexota bacterium]